MCGNGARLPGIEGGFVTTLTPEQARALDHAHEVLAEERDATSLPDAEWRRMLRLALGEVVVAFAEAAPVKRR
jgi:hypothetical protein